ncbi:MAG: hypothetical protein AB7L17_19845 [Ilumatobacteraceae bacterium]
MIAMNYHVPFTYEIARAEIDERLRRAQLRRESIGHDERTRDRFGRRRRPRTIT